MAADQVSMHRVAVDMYKMEKDQYWIRCNVFLVINSALMVALFSERATNMFREIDCSLGFCLCLAWLFISIHSEYYIKRWRDIVRQIELGLEVQPFLSFPKDSVVFQPPNNRLVGWLLFPLIWVVQGGPSRIMNLVILSLVALWAVMGLLNPFGTGKIENAPDVHLVWAGGGRTAII